jgi:ribosome recycling factor
MQNRAEKAYSDGVAEAQATLQAVTTKVCTELDEYAVSKISQSIPADAITDLNTLKSLENVSLSELEVYVDKYKGCNMALRILSGIAKKNGFTLQVNTLDDIRSHIAKIKNAVDSIAGALPGTNNEAVVQISLLRLLTPNTSLGIDALFEQYDKSFVPPTICPRELNDVEKEAIEAICGGKTDEELCSLYNSSSEISNLIKAHPVLSQRVKPEVNTK